ncbi:MAG TPA: hypothetical protein VLL25_00195 [Acidimicrobiales bacterium]|nr:hypothetical protein [Acidimicrobiales bacterium]
MERNPAKTFAAFDDPYRHPDRLARERDAHDAVLARRPADVHAALAAAVGALAEAEHDVKKAEQRGASSRRRLDNTGGLGLLLPSRRRQHADTEARLRFDEQGVADCQDRLEQRGHQVALLESQAQSRRDFDRAESWRQQRIGDVDHQLDRYWADVVLAAARAGDPYAYGRDRLERAYQTLVDQTRTSSRDQTVERQLADLERAVLTSRPPRPVPLKAAAEREGPSIQHAVSATRAHDLHARDDGREVRIGL